MVPERRRASLLPVEQKEYLRKLDERRTELTKEALDLDKKRSDYLAQEQGKGSEKGKGKDGFDNQVLEVLRKQARKAQIDY